MALGSGVEVAGWHCGRGGRVALWSGWQGGTVVGVALWSVVGVAGVLELKGVCGRRWWLKCSFKNAS